MATTADQNLNLTATAFTNTGTLNDHNPAGFSTAGTYEHNSGVAVTLNGLVPGRSGRLIGLRASAGGAVEPVCAAEAAGSSAANRFAHAVTGPRLIWYSPASLRWRRIGNAT